MQPDKPVVPVSPPQQHAEPLTLVTPIAPIVNALEPKKAKSKKSIFFILLMVILVAIPAFPVVAIGSLFVGCQVRMFNLEQKESKTRANLEKLGLQATHQDVFVNGDCTTASGVGMNLEVVGNYPSLLAAKDDIFNKLNEAGVAAPSNSIEPKYILGKDGNRGGGATPISEIEVIYPSGSDFSAYTLLINLPQPIPCAVNELGSVICGGEDKDTLLKNIISTRPILSVEVSGGVR